jgi:2-polyprenyl-3-methyl-5-hydroxy-6-metoxy-1,4-benzoquinol methylase
VTELGRCRSCRTQYWWSVAPGIDRSSEYWEDYKFELYEDAAVLRSYHERYARMLSMLAGLGIRPLTLLDIGGGIGNFAEWATGQGISALMSDVDPVAVDSARRRGVRAYTPDELDTAVPKEGVDVVTLWDVVEHTAEPAALVGEALTRLRAGGVIFIETPDAAFPVRQMLLKLRSLTQGRVDRTGSMYYWEHKVYFTEKGLSILLGQLGLRVLKVEHWTSPRAKIVKLFSRGGPQGVFALNRAIARAYPLAQASLERLRLGNKLIVVATTDG